MVITESLSLDYVVHISSHQSCYKVSETYKHGLECFKPSEYQRLQFHN